MLKKGVRMKSEEGSNDRSETEVLMDLIQAEPYWAKGVAKILGYDGRDLSLTDPSPECDSCLTVIEDPDPGVIEQNKDFGILMDVIEMLLGEVYRVGVGELIDPDEIGLCIACLVDILK